MYEAYFGLSGPPFQLNPDPTFYFNSRGHGHALAYLRYGVAQGEGFIVVTGEIGAGKTTLLRALLDELDRAQVVAAQIVSTQLESGDLLQAIVTAFGIPTQGSNKASLIATLEAFLMTLATQGRRALLIIDEAQNLEIRSIEELRMLSNFQLGTQSLLQSFLVGQPELRKKLESPAMEQLRQRVTASCHLGPLGAEETRAYVEHRLKLVGWTERPRFIEGAFAQIHRWSGGIPRRINRLANRLLLAAFLESRDDIDAALVEQTAQELRQEIGEGSFEPLALTSEMAAAAESRGTQGTVKVPDTAEEAPTATSLEADATGLDLNTAHEEARDDTSIAQQAPALPVGSIERDAGTLVDPGGAAPDLTAEISGEVTAEVEVAQRMDGTGTVTLGSEGESAVNGLVAHADVPAEPGQQQTAAPLAAIALAAGQDADARGDANPAVAAVAAEESHRSEAPVHPAAMAPEEEAFSIEASEPRMAMSPLTRIERPGHRVRKGVLLCIADNTSAALKIAAIAKAVDAYADMPQLVLLSPGQREQVWPWDDMDSTLPAPEVAIHLGVPALPFELIAATLFERLGIILDEFKPLGALVLGASDAVLGCSLVAHKRGIPLVRAEAGERSSALTAETDVNARLVEQLADVLLVSNGPDAHQRLYRQGIPAARVYGVPGRLASDVVGAMLPSMTTPYGAFLRHRLPIFLGPRWSSEVDGTAYALVALRLPQTYSYAVAGLIDVLAGTHAVPKLIWLADTATRNAIREWQQATPDRSDDIFVIEEDLPRAALDKRNSARVLCSDIRSLPDQLSVLRGAVALIAEPDDALCEAAALLGIPTIALESSHRFVQCLPEGAAVELPVGTVALNEVLRDIVAMGEPAAPVSSLQEPMMAAAAVGARLRAWAHTRAEHGTATPGQMALAKGVEPPSPVDRTRDLSGVPA